MGGDIVTPYRAMCEELRLEKDRWSAAAAAVAVQIKSAMSVWDPEGICSLGESIQVSFAALQSVEGKIKDSTTPEVRVAKQIASWRGSGTKLHPNLEPTLAQHGFVKNDEKQTEVEQKVAEEGKEEGEKQIEVEQKAAEEGKEEGDKQIEAGQEAAEPRNDAKQIEEKPKQIAAELIAEMEDAKQTKAEQIAAEGQ